EIRAPSPEYSRMPSYSYSSGLRRLLNRCAVRLADEIVLGEIVVPVLLPEVRTRVHQLVVDGKAERLGADEVQRWSFELPNLDRVDDIGDSLELAGVGAVDVIPGGATVSRVVHSDPLVEGEVLYIDFAIEP